MPKKNHHIVHPVPAKSGISQWLTVLLSSLGGLAAVATFICLYVLSIQPIAPKQPSPPLNSRYVRLDYGALEKVVNKEVDAMAALGSPAILQNDLWQQLQQNYAAVPAGSIAVGSNDRIQFAVFLLLVNPSTEQVDISSADGGLRVHNLQPSGGVLICVHLETFSGVISDRLPDKLTVTSRSRVYAMQLDALPPIAEWMESATIPGMKFGSHEIGVSKKQNGS
jgi:hypothetical protein